MLRPHTLCKKLVNLLYQIYLKMGKTKHTINTNRHAKIAFLVALAISAILFIVGFFLPPMGKIDGSVLIAGGSIMLFTLLYIALVYNAGVSLGVDLDDKTVTLSTQKKDDEDES